MDKEKWKLYNELVDKWSRIFKQKFGTLMDYDDIKQEAWVAILSAEDYDKDFERTYLGTCIKNHLNRLLLDTIYRNRVESGDVIEERTVDTQFGSPEKLAIASDLQDKLEMRIKKIPHGLFVWKHMDEHSVREIAKIGVEHGLPLSKSAVHRIIEKIRIEYDSL